MKTSVDSIACAAMRQPSISRCGTRAITSRSLKAPGSDSSALTTRYFGFALFRSMSDALRPIGKPAPPRPRRTACSSSAISASGVIARAFSTPREPPIAWYSASCVRSRSSAPARRTLCSAIELPEDLGHRLGPAMLAGAGGDGHARGVAAAAEALDRAERDLSVRRGLARSDAELRLEGLDHLLRAAERAREVRAHLNRVPPDRLEMEHVVEGRDRIAEGRRDLERLCGLLERLAGQPAVLLLREPQRRQHRRPRALGIARPQLLHLVAEGAHRSVSPMTASSEPTTAIRSATRAWWRQVAVASSATKDGARKCTRQGFGPPSETR